MKQSRDDLVAHLREQLGFLRASCAAYDTGLFGEAKRLAVAIAILVHDTDRSASLLTQLSAKEIPFVDTGAYRDVIDQMMEADATARIEENKKKGKKTAIISISQRLLYMASFKKDGSVVGPWAPILESGLENCRWLPFDEWWAQDVVTVGQAGHLSRKELVLSMRDKDGGAHIDSTLTPVYAELTRAETSKIRVFHGDELIHESSPEHGTIRQIAFEIDHSISTHLQDLLA